MLLFIFAIHITWQLKLFFLFCVFQVFYDLPGSATHLMKWTCKFCNFSSYIEKTIVNHCMDVEEQVLVVFTRIVLPSFNPMWNF